MRMRGCGAARPAPERRSDVPIQAVLGRRRREAAEASYAVTVQPGHMILVGPDAKLLVLDVVPFEEDDSPYTGMLRVEAA